MRIKEVPALLKLTFVLILPLLLSGCISHRDSESRGVKLSEAMDSSAKGDQRDLGGSSSDGDHSSDGVVASSCLADSTGIFGANYDETEYGWQVLADVTYSTSFNGDIQGVTHFTLTPICLEDEHNFFGLYLGGATVEFKSGSLPDLGAKDPWMLEVGLTYRRYLNSSRDAFSPYIGGNLGYQLLVWDYRNPVVTGSETIKHDALCAGQGTVVFGVSTRRDKSLSVFGEVGLGATLFFSTTEQGFENDVFDDYGFFSVKAGLSVKF